MTLFSERFKQAGLLPREVELDRAIALFLNQGGTFDQAQARLDAAKKLSGGAGRSQPQGQSAIASSRQPESSGEQLPPLANDEGQRDLAVEATAPLPLVREPSQAQLRANAAVAKAAALSAFDRELTFTGRRWGNVTYRELDSMIDGLAEDLAIAKAIKSHTGQLRGEDRHKTVRELMTPREFATLINKIRRQHRERTHAA